MDFDSDLAGCGGVICIAKKKRKKRGMWTKKEVLERNTFSHMLLLLKLAFRNSEDLKNYLRMNEKTFEGLLGHISQHIQKEDTGIRQSVFPKERLFGHPYTVEYVR